MRFLSPSISRATLLAAAAIAIAAPACSGADPTPSSTSATSSSKCASPPVGGQPCALGSMGPIECAASLGCLSGAEIDAAGRTLCPVSISGNLGGLTLAPGLYKSTSGLAISSRDLTLDAKGNANAVFIFQMATTLTTSAGRQVF